MAFSYTVTADEATHLVGNWYLARGTWTAGGDANGEIVTGLSNVMAGDAYLTEAVASEAPARQINVDGAAAASLGSIGILAVADAANNVGAWWAIGEL